MAIDVGVDYAFSSDKAGYDWGGAAFNAGTNPFNYLIFPGASQGVKAAGFGGRLLGFGDNLAGGFGKLAGKEVCSLEGAVGPIQRLGGEAPIQEIFRSGGKNPSNLKLRPGETGLSFRDSLSNPWPLKEGQRPVFPVGGEYSAYDVFRLPAGTVIFDNVPPGHVTVVGATIEQLQKAFLYKGKFP